MQLDAVTPYGTLSKTNEALSVILTFFYKKT